MRVLLLWSGDTPATLRTRVIAKPNCWDLLGFVMAESPMPMKGASTGGIIGGILCVIILIAVIATTIVMVRKCKRKNIDRPPTHKPPPPMKTYSDEDRPTISKPMYEERMYYETDKGEPMTDLSAYYNDKDHHEPSWEDKQTPYHDDRDEDEAGMMGEDGIYHISSSATRGSSFMSSAVIV